MKEEFNNFIDKKGKINKNEEIRLFDSKNETLDNSLMPDMLNFFTPSNKQEFPFMEKVKIVNSKETVSGTILKNDIGINEDGKKYQILIYSSQDNIKFTKFDLLVDTATRVLWNQHIHNNGKPNSMVTSIDEYIELLKEENKNKTELKRYIINSLTKFSNINFKIINRKINKTETALYFNMSYFQINILDNGEIRIYFNDEYIKNIYENQKIFNYDINELKSIKSDTGKFLYRLLKQYEDESNSLTFDVFDLAKNLLINTENKKGYEINRHSFQKPLKELKNLKIIDDFKYSRNKITIFLTKNKIIESQGYYFYIQSYNELKENLVNNGKMVPSLFERIYNHYGNKKLSINYEKIRAYLLQKNKVSNEKEYINKYNKNIYSEIGKLLHNNYKNNQEPIISDNAHFKLKYYSLGYLKIQEDK